MLLIFDCDGVLVDSEVIALEILSTLMGEQGHPMSVAACQDVFMGMHNDDIVREVERRIGKPLPIGFAQHTRELMMARMESELQPVAGVADALRRLDQPRCVASSSDHARVASTLRWTGLAGFFDDAIFSGLDVPRGKPAPDLFLHAAEKMGAHPDHCVVIEDSVAGITAAVAARMRVVGFVGASHGSVGQAEKLRDAGADIVISSMSDLPATLSALAAADVA